MARSEEAEAFFHAVYSAVQEIPPGRVTSYGHIAKLIGTHPSHRFHSANVPWQRVINSRGIISPRGSHPGGAQNQAAALRAEGVVVTTGPLGELMVDLDEYGWFPEVLPSEEGLLDEEEG
ncbi:hypothetical protein VTJ49DRAFT_1652 [Mycothermus thermophilus]|uniref:Methylated-DNA-[protein]-cysteine S-methyltransferase DNA binding domain-containing protein n=1 Tax=Humicola insolens TaxID=85995 RepID=A0ABR3VBV1_HUMIN